MEDLLAEKYPPPTPNSQEKNEQPPLNPSYPTPIALSSSYRHNTYLIFFACLFQVHSRLFNSHVQH